MQARPSNNDLLQAISKFLLGEIYPAVADQRLRFRVLIAANVANVVAAQLQSLDDLAKAELSRLAELMPDLAAAESPRSDAECSELVSKLNRELAARIRQRRFAGEQRSRLLRHIKETLIRSLAIENPRFDTSPEIE
jgi:hypothetical protein